MRLGPIGFLFAVVGVWTAARTIMLSPHAPASPVARRVAWAPPLAREQQRAAPVSISFVSSEVETHGARRTLALRLRSLQTEEEVRPESVFVPAQRVAESPRPAATEQSIVPFIAAPGIDRWSLSAWALMRGSGAPVLAAGGQLAGSQLGFRLRRRVAPGLHLAVRVSGPLQTDRGKEAALAVDLQLLQALPVTFTAERRVGLDGGGRDAFAVGAFGGFDARLTPRLSVDGYAQAGAVGLKRRDLYVDGSLRMEREIVGGPKPQIGIGVGAWGGAQPGVARVDLGPQLVAHLPLASGGIRIGGEWRQRVAGDARPGSGPVLSLGADF